MLTLIIWAVIVAVVVLIAGLVIWRVAGPSSQPDAGRVAAEPAKERLSGDSHPAKNDDETVVPDFPPAQEQAFKELRAFLRQGIDELFAVSHSALDENLTPKSREDIDPLVLQNALDQLAGLKQIHTEHPRMQKLISDPTVPMAELSKVILTDPVMTAKVLKMVNSSYFGIQQKIDSISHALMILGLQNVRNVLYREGVRGLFDPGEKRVAARMAELWKHANRVSVCASHLADLIPGLSRGTLFTLGIIHDIGKLILMEMAATPDDYPPDLRISEEDLLFGLNHAVAGGCVMEQWNFSALMVESVSLHHAPSFVDAPGDGQLPEAMKYALVLFLADQVARRFADLNDGNVGLYPLRVSYHGLIDREKLTQKVTDTNFLIQMHAADLIAAAEHPSFR